ncbi:MAG: metalloregulator ArsR/SmtB family transcription factor [Isosphaeraceae bacterium]
MSPPSLPNDEDFLDRVAARFAALGDPIRLRIIAILLDGEKPVHEIVETLGYAQSNVSKHLKRLTEGGILRRRRQGLHVYYSVEDPVVETLCVLVCESIGRAT